jgi:low affinity Fe/Cu permease
MSEEQRSPASATRLAADDRSVFDRFVEGAHTKVSQAPFFVGCVVVIAVWLVSVPLWADLKAWQVAIHTVTSVTTLLLIALLENAGRRSEEAEAEKLNVIAEALSALMTSRAMRDDPELQEAAKRLRDSVGLEERH